MNKPAILATVNERIVITVAGTGMLLSTLDTGIINVALPSLGHEFSANVTEISWTVTMYLITLSATIIAFGRISDRFGRVKVFTLGLFIFMLASILCGFSISLPMLVLFRACQGIGAAMVQATAAALITTLVSPARRGPAIGILGVMLGLGPLLGPVVGGFLLSSIGWRWIFWINFPICLLGLWGCFKLSDSRDHCETLKLDIVGNVLLALSVLALIWSLSTLSATAFLPYLLFALFIVFAIAFFVWEYRTAYPIIALRLLRSPSLVAPLLSIMSFGAATSIAFIVPPYFLEEVVHLVPWQVGFVSLSAPLGIVVIARISGGLITKAGTKMLMVIGLIIMLLALIILSTMQSSWSALLLAFLLFAYGVGGGFFQPANISAVMDEVSANMQGTIGAIQRMVQNVAIAIGTAAAAALLRIHTGSGIQGAMLGFRLPWMFASLLILLGLVSFAFLRMKSPQQAIPQ
jgi:EmrB/QacA subfamily drug resistance transporter